MIGKRFLSSALMCGALSIGSLVSGLTLKTVLADTSVDGTEVVQEVVTNTYETGEERTNANGYKYMVDEVTGNATITGYIGSNAYLEIPSQINGYNVTKIADYALEQNWDIISVVIPSSITEIGEYAFYQCDNLKTVEFKEGINDAIIGACAFLGTNVQSIVIPGNYKVIDHGAFYCCTNLVGVEFRKSNSGIADQKILAGAFALCGNLKSFGLWDTVSEIADDAFKNSNILYFWGDINEYIANYAKEQRIDYVTSYGETEDGFTYNVSYGKAIITGYTGTETDITIPAEVDGYKVKKINTHAFYRNKTIQRITISEGIEEIDNEAFYNCDFESIELPSTITYLYERAICSNGQLKNIILNPGKEDVTVEAYAFGFNVNLQYIRIPANYTIIKSLAFNNCIALETIIFETDGIYREEQRLNGNIFSNCNIKTIVMPPTINIKKYVGEDIFYDIASDYDPYIIYGCEGSTAQAYAIEKNLTFIPYKAVLNGPSVSTVGSEITLNAIESTGYGKLQYSYIMHDINTDTWFRYDDGEFVDRNYLTLDVTEALKTKEFYVEAKDGAGIVTRSVPLSIDVYEKITGKLELNEATTGYDLAVGDTVKFDVSAVGGSGSFTYRFVMYDVDKTSSTIIRDYGSSNTFVYQLTDDGNKEFIVYVKDSVENETTLNNIKVVIKDRLQVVATSNMSNAIVGEVVNITATAIGGSKDYTYSCYIHNLRTDEWFSFEDGKFVENNIFNWDTSDFTSGQHHVYVEVKDAIGRIVRSDAKRIDLFEPINIEITLDDSVTADDVYDGVGHKLVLGNTVKLEAKATGGNEVYQYQFMLIDFETNKYTVLREYANSDTYMFEAEKIGYMGYAVMAMDGHGKSSMSKVIDVTVVNPLKIVATADKTSAIVGDKITISAKGLGGVEDYTYSFLVYNSDTRKWHRFNNDEFSKKNTLTWKASSSGTRKFFVEVKDGSGEVVRSEAITVIIKDEPLTIAATVSKTIIEVGQTIDISSNVTGGKGAYTYSYLIYNPTTKKWHRVNKTFTENNSYTWKAKETGTRKFFVEVKDEAGNIVRSEAVTINIVEPLKITIEANDVDVKVGEKVKLTALATGGTKSYTYSFLVYNISTKKWYRYNEGEFTEKSTYTWRASDTGKRKFFVEVKDGSGNVVRSEGIIIKVNK